MYLYEYEFEKVKDLFRYYENIKRCLKAQRDGDTFALKNCMATGDFFIRVNKDNYNFNSEIKQALENELKRVMDELKSLGFKERE